jgi:hypothetical protein
LRILLTGKELNVRIYSIPSNDWCFSGAWGCEGASNAKSGFNSNGVSVHLLASYLVRIHSW